MTTDPTDGSATEDYGQPHPAAAHDLAPFAFIVGRWQARGRAVGLDGVWSDVSMVWTARYILNGHAIAGVYHNQDEDGLTVAAIDFRCYDRERGRWVIEWMDPGSATLRSQGDDDLGGVQLGENDVTLTSRAIGFLHRETFRDIATDRFTYTASISRDAGRSWTDVEVTKLTRVAGSTTTRLAT
jgi:hypothetical protein